MRHVPTLLRRELGAYFLGPMAFLILLAFQFVAWLHFWELVDSLSAPQRELSSVRDPMSTYIAGSPGFWIAILVAVPMLTMRLLAEERRSGAIEALLTVPVTVSFDTPRRRTFPARTSPSSACNNSSGATRASNAWRWKRPCSASAISASAFWTAPIA